MHEFTIFITSFNYGHYIGKAIESVVQQTVSEWNLYILDNGSTDNTEAVVSAYLSDQRIHFIKHKTNIGHSKNIIFGFTELPGKYISTLQADDWIESNYIEKALTAFHAHPKIPLVAFGWMAFAEPNTYSYADTIPFPRSFSGLTYLSPHLTLGNFIPLHLMAFRQTEIEQIFRELAITPLYQQGEQYIVKRLEDRNGPSFFSAEVAGYWRRHEQQLTSTHAKNFTTCIEDTIEPLIYCQVKDKFNPYSRLLSLIRFITFSAKIPYRDATTWLTGSDGRYFPEKYGISIDETKETLECLACALLMANKVFATTRFVNVEKISEWVNELCRKNTLSVRDILTTANRIYDNYLLPHDLLELVAIQFEHVATSPTSRHSTDPNYAIWLAQRFLALENASLPQETDTAPEPKNFHLFLRLAPGDESLLADTLDSLGQQLTQHWHLDVVTTLPAPEGLLGIPCVGWHTLSSMEHAKSGIDELAEARHMDWLVELPAGTRLDPLYLWRLEREIRTQPDAIAFFVDDDCTDGQSRFSPRFKPGCNPAAMLSADLAGPLCVSREIWIASGGTGSKPGSPWFSQLLHVASYAGWQRIRHVADVLLTYPHNFPSDQSACIEAYQHHDRSLGQQTEITPISPTGWSVRPVSEQRPVSLAIISQGNLDLLERCLNSIVSKAAYPRSALSVVISQPYTDPELDTWLQKQRTAGLIGDIICIPENNHAARCNAAVAAARFEHVLLISEEAVVVQESWIAELMGSFATPDIAASTPRLIAPGSAAIQSAGCVLGLAATIGTPYGGKGKIGDSSYLDCLNLSRDVSTLNVGCMLVCKADYERVGGMDTSRFGNNHAETDLGLRLRTTLGKRIVYQPRATLIFDGLAQAPSESRETAQLEARRKKLIAGETLVEIRGRQACVDPFWNPSLSLSNPMPIPETAYMPQWQFLPTVAPRILAHTLNNGQGVFRVTAALNQLAQSGRATECVWEQDGKRIPTPQEVMRLQPNTFVVQHYIQERHLATLEGLQRIPDRPFIVYTLDDLITKLPETNPFRKNIPANSRSCLKYALERCDRLVVSTDFLAETYRGFVSDIRVVPNALEQRIWSRLTSRKRTQKKPRIGWAGGSTHHGDLSLLKEVIEQTRNEADWIFFGLCPPELRPLVSEFHPLGPFNEYPARLAALNLDLAVAPLVEHPFNQGKSNLRLLEYGILGIPTVCTDITPYRDSPACKVRNDTQSWVEALQARIHDADAREAEGQELKQWVYRHFLLENNLDQWLAAHLP